MQPSSFTLYILRTSANTYYIGQTNDLEKRLEEHRAHGPASAKYMKYFPSFTLVYTEKFGTRSDAMKREAYLKKLSRPKKDQLIRSAIL